MKLFVNLLTNYIVIDIMRKKPIVFISPDSFKGTISAMRVAEIISEVFQKKGYETISVPVADGGEGTVDSILYSNGGEKKYVYVNDPLGRHIKSFYGYSGKKAYIEIAQSSGLMLLKENELNPMITTTFGFGELIFDAYKNGFREFFLGLGGTATNDAGIGMLSSLGVKFFDNKKNEIKGLLSAQHLHLIEKVDISEIKIDTRKININVLCDVQNPLTGDNGTSRIYSPQKGASNKVVEKLENAVKHFAKIISEQLSAEPEFPGAGAAGGVAMALKIFLNGKLVPGINTLIEILDLERKISNADIVIVGEGSLDHQSVFGKAPVGIAMIAKKYNKPVLAIAGKIGKNPVELFKYGIDCIYSSYGNVPVPIEEIKISAEENLFKIAGIAADEASFPELYKNKIFVLNET